MLKINDNITLYHIPMDNLKTTSVGAYIYRPLCHSDVSKNALLPYVLQRGCKICPSMEALSKMLDDLYGASFNANVMKQGDIQVIGFSGKTISDRYAPEGEKLTKSLTELMMSVMFEPIVQNGTFPEDVMTQEKKGLRDCILGMLNDKRAYTQLKCTESMCGDDVFSLSKYGTVQGVDEIDGKSLYDYYKSMITSSVIDIFVCGDADMKEAEETIRGFVSELEFTPAHIPSTTSFAPSDTENECSECIEVTQGKLCIGLTTDITSKDKLYGGLMLANSILGGGVHSKLFNNVREKLSLAYYASSMVEKDKGLMFINSGIEFENYEKALAEIKAQIEQLKNGSITEEELSASRLAIINSLDSYYDEHGYMQIFKVSQRASGTDMTIEDLKKTVSEVSLDEIIEAAKRIKLNTVYFLKGAEK